jgi:hypothetical protein
MTRESFENAFQMNTFTGQFFWQTKISVLSKYLKGKNALCPTKLATTGMNDLNYLLLLICLCLRGPSKDQN